MGKNYLFEFMNKSILVIDFDKCYITDTFNHLKYQGTLICDGFQFYLWKIDKYIALVLMNLKYLNEINIHYVFSNFSIYNDINNKQCLVDTQQEIPEQTEILIVRFLGLELCNKIPAGVKVICCNARSNINMKNVSDYNLPIGLKYLCFRKEMFNHVENKIKIPFECKIIYF